MSTSPRYGGFTLRTECTNCGNPLPLDRPAREATCGSCQSRVDVPAEVWRHVLEAYEGEQRPAPGKLRTESETVAGFPLQLQVASLNPRCERCGEPYALEGLEDASEDFACVSCGDKASTWPAPEWLRRLVPTARQIVSIDPGGATLPEGAPLDEQLTEAPRPVAMPCPQCKASLSITAEHERIVPCQYCGTDVFLPDEIWLRLHPVKTVRWWYVRFEGLTPAEQLAANNEERAAEELRKARERAARAFALMPKVWPLTILCALWHLAVPWMAIDAQRLVRWTGLSLSSVVWTIVLGSVGLYTVALTAGWWPAAVARGKKVWPSVLAPWFGGAVGCLPPGMGALLALFLPFVLFSKRDPDKPTSGVYRPLIVTFTCFAIAAQIPFFYFVIANG